MRNFCLLTFMVLSMWLSMLHAQTTKNITVEEPGTFAEKMGADAATVTHLTISGKLNTKDFTTFSTMKALQELDMLNVTIVDAKGKSTGVIPSYTFFKKTALQKVVMPTSLKNVGEDAFFKCSALKTVVFSTGVETIGTAAFMGCNSLSEVNLPATVSNIKSKAFYGVAFKDFTAPASLKSIGTNAFYGSKLETVKLNAGLTSIGEAAFGGCHGMRSIDFEEGNALYHVVDGVLFDATDTLLLAYLPTSPRTKYSCPKTVKKIGMAAFDGAVNLLELRINEGVQALPTGMCYNDTTLQKLYLPSTLKTVAAGALDFCTRLSEVHIRATVPPVAATGAFGIMFPNYKMNLYVPKGCKAAYEKAEEWSDKFLSINEEDEEVCSVTMKTKHAVGEYIGLSIKTDGDVEVIGATYESPGVFKVDSEVIEIRGKITKLDCSSDKLTSLDVSNEPGLTLLCCDNNEIEDLKLGNLPQLQTLYCGENKLQNIDLAGLGALQDLSCWGNMLTNIDVSANPQLVSLICRDNKLEGTLDLSANPKVNQVNCYNNALTAIKLATNSELKHLEMQRNNIKGANMTNLMNSLPTYVAFPAEEWDDYLGMNLQGLYVTEKDPALEKNVALVSDVNIAKGKGWPVFAMNIADYGDIAPSPYDGQDVSAVGQVESVPIDVCYHQETGQCTLSGVEIGTEILIFDLYGRQVERLVANEVVVNVDMTQFSAGAYLLRAGKNVYKVMVK